MTIYRLTNLTAGKIVESLVCGPDDVVIDFYDSKVSDHSGIEAVDSLAERYKRHGKTLHLKHLSQECRELLETAGGLVEVNMMEDPSYHVADDKFG